MLTPQDVTNRVFDKAVFGGYDIGAVDSFLEELSQDYAALYRDNATLKSKLKVLVDKVEEYRNTEDAMRLALLTAQKTARELTDEAEKKAAAILEEANGKAAAISEGADRAREAMRAELRESLRDEENALLNAKRRTAEYLATLNKAMEDYRSSLTHIYDFAEPLEELPPIQPRLEPEQAAEEPPVEPAAEELPAEPDMGISVDDVAKMIEATYASGAAEEKEPEQTGERELPHIDYENLKFGAEYARDKKK